jgi:hypothetical protein
MVKATVFPEYLSFFLVIRPNGRQSGQKPIRLVITNTPARIKMIIAGVPEITV